MKMTKKHKQGLFAAHYLVLVAGGYWMATNTQLEAVAAKFNMTNDALEGYYFEVCEAAEQAALNQSEEA